MPEEKTLSQVLTEQGAKADEFIANVVSEEQLQQGSDEQIISLRVKFTLLLASLKTMRDYNDGLPVEILNMIEQKYQSARNIIDDELVKRELL